MPDPITSLVLSSVRCTKCGTPGVGTCKCWDAKPDADAVGAAMIEVCELAVKWQKHGRRYELRLSSAISKLKSLGF
jgi:hypothetical protein